MAEHAGKGFIWYELMTTDVDAAKAFYGNVVGWQTHDSGMPGPMRYELFGIDGKDVGGMMTMPDSAEHKAMWMAHIYTPDVDTAVAAVTEHGGSILRPPMDIPNVGRFAVVRDPQSAVYLLFQPGGGMWEPLGAQAIGNIGWHELMTSDWEQAWDFYSGLYGWTKHMSVDMGPMGTYQTFMTTEVQGGGMMSLTQAMKDAGVPPHWTYYLTVDSIQAAKQRVEDGGGKVTHGPMQVPGGAWVLQGIDPQGARFALTAKS